MKAAPAPGSEGVPETARHAIAELLDDYVAALDEDNLEAWPEFFSNDGQYKVLSRENVSLGLPAPLMYYYSRGMMRDRVRALREALTYQPVFSRHICAAPRFRAGKARDVLVTSNFSVYHTTEEGVTQLFTTGQYVDVIALTKSEPRFRSRTVTMDTFGVRNLIAVPL